MDGSKRKITQSLQFKLSLWLSVLVVFVALIATAFSYAMAFQDANELQDDQLRQVGEIVYRHFSSFSHTESQEQVADTDPETRVIIQIQDNQEVPSASTNADLIVFPSDLPMGMQTIQIHQEPWRVLVRSGIQGTRILVGQQAEVRDEIARHSIKNTLFPFGALILILLLLIASLIHNIFKPMKQLGEELHARSDDNLTEIEMSKLPLEIQPLVAGINRQFVKVAELLAMQRRFITDAAHELRSPMTALSLQTEQLATREMSSLAAEQVRTVRHGIKRTQSLLEQLMSLARAQASVMQTDTTETSVCATFRLVMEDLLPLAEAKKIDIGITSLSDVKLPIAEIHLRTLIKNLLENAIRYTQPGGVVDFSVIGDGDSVVLQIEDTGPGIPVNERERVFDPFYRVLGSEETGAGLGLAIVKTIALKLQAGIKLAESSIATDGKGLQIKITFPKPAAT
jgi:two-component system OmpR family sensor kinase